MSENKKLSEHVTSKFEITIRPSVLPIKPIEKYGHQFIGPFVRIHTNKDKSELKHIYINVFFSSFVECLDISIAKNGNTYNCQIQPKEKGESSEERSLWEITLTPLESIKTINCEYFYTEVSFNESNPDMVGDPTRGTIVIPPKGSSKD